MPNQQRGKNLPASSAALSSKPRLSPVSTSIMPFSTSCAKSEGTIKKCRPTPRVALPLDPACPSLRPNMKKGTEAVAVAAY